SSRRRHTRSKRDWSSDVCSSDLPFPPETGKNLVDAWGKNKFQVYDNLVQIDQNDSSFTFKLDNEEKLEFDYVINATGNDLNVTHDMAQVPLISQLANERIIQ